MRRSALLVALPLLFVAASLHAQQTLPSAAAAKWGPAPPFLPAGVQFTVVQGDPGAPGEYTIRLRMAAGYTVPPHWHPTDEHVTVISGTLLLGMGDTVHRSTATRVTAGGFITAPATKHHYAVAAAPTVVQIHGRGPFAITYVRAADDPRTTHP